MKLFDRLDKNINYNNSQTIRKSMDILDKEFNLAVKNKDLNYAKEVIDVANSINNKLLGLYKDGEDSNKTMGYMQRVWANNLRVFIWGLTKRLKDDFWNIYD